MKKTRNWKVGDQFQVVGNHPNNSDLEGHIGTIQKINDPGEYQTYHVLFDNEAESSRWREDGDMQFISKKDMQKINSMQKVHSMFKRLVDADTQALYKAGFINGDLELTAEGTKELMVLLFDSQKTALVEAAKSKIAEETKKETE